MYFIVGGVWCQASLFVRAQKIEAEFERHENFNKTVRDDNDVAILKLKTPLEFNNNVQKACLPPPNYKPENVDKTMGTISGWGNTVDGNILW